jgi:alpha-D-ribose 1-methylphosphonate 5-triphosphate synthase subunit PhnG
LIEKHVITPVAKRLAAEKQRRREEVAPTRVDFFTMARGED